MRRLTVLLILAAMILPANADPLIPDDFARGAPIIMQTGHPVYRLKLTEAVYRNLFDEQLADLRVFNDANEVVPHTLRQSRPRIEEPATLALPWFPLYDNAETVVGGSSVHIRADSNGAIIEVQSPDGRDGDERLSGYLIDLSAIDQDLRELEVFWQDEHDGGFVLRVSVDASSDLNRWEPLVRDASLVELGYGEHRLAKRTINLPSNQARYLRINWPKDAGGKMISRLVGHSGLPAGTPSRQWTQFSPERGSEKPLAFEFGPVGRFPVDQINVSLPTANTAFEAAIESRATEDAPWQVRGRGLFYSLEFNGEKISNVPLPVRSTRDPWWRVQLQDDDLANAVEPTMTLGWVPHDLYFVAQGNPPFLLAFGSAAIRESSRSVDQLLKSLNADGNSDMIQEATIGPLTDLGGEARFDIERVIPWQRLLLWLVLIVGVALLGLMAVRLVRQMNKSSS